MKRPSFQFYPGDWLNDAALRMVSVAARGLWMDMICLMHQGSDYGYLKVNHKVILPANLARMVGATLQEVEGWTTELEDAGVFARDEEGCIFSRRMIRDEQVRSARAAGGKLGGNPKLLKRKEEVTEKVDDKVNLPANLEPTPSSSSSSSSSKERKPKATPAALPDWLPQKPWDDFVAMRKKNRKPLTDEAMHLLVGKLDSLRAEGHDPAAVLNQSTMNGWQGVFALRNGDRREGERRSNGRPSINDFPRPDDEGDPFDTLRRA